MKNSEKSDLYESESDETFAMKRRRFTNTVLPVFSGAECWFQHFHIVQAIVKSNGWPEETAALQLFAHLKGEALNVALLLTREKRESWTGLVSGLSAYYQSPGRLAVLRRRFESAFRRPGLDPATFATELGILAIQGFEDMKEQARDTMIRDKFITFNASPFKDSVHCVGNWTDLHRTLLLGRSWIVAVCGRAIQNRTGSPR